MLDLRPIKAREPSSNRAHDAAAVGVHGGPVEEVSLDDTVQPGQVELLPLQERADVGTRRVDRHARDGVRDELGGEDEVGMRHEQFVGRLEVRAEGGDKQASP